MTDRIVAESGEVVAVIIRSTQGVFANCVCCASRCEVDGEGAVNSDQQQGNYYFLGALGEWP